MGPQYTISFSINPPQHSVALSINTPVAPDIIAQLVPFYRGGTAAPPTTRTLTWVSGRLNAVLYVDGRSRLMTYTGDQLTRVDRLAPSGPIRRADLSYNPDGTLAAITESEV